MNYLSEIDRAVSRASAIVQRLLTFSRKMETHFEAVNLNRVVDESLHLLRHTLPKNLTIETDLEEELAEIQADPTQLEQVLMNLAGNAGEAMPDGGRLTIETRMITLGNEHRERYPDLNPGDYVKLSVMDTGHGMDEEILQRIFEPFFTTKEVGKGTGLGLSIVLRYIEKPQRPHYLQQRTRPRDDFPAVSAGRRKQGKRKTGTAG